MALELLTVGGFVLSAGFFTAALEDEPPPLDKKRWGCLVFSGALLCVALLVGAAGWVTLLSGLAFVMSVAVVALAAHRDRSREQSRKLTMDPAWWPQFEQDFEDYVRLGSAPGRRDDSHRGS
jgi:hypothetical protein